MLHKSQSQGKETKSNPNRLLISLMTEITQHDTQTHLNYFEVVTATAFLLPNNIHTVWKFKTLSYKRHNSGKFQERKRTLRRNYVRMM